MCVSLRVTADCTQGGRRYMEDTFAIGYNPLSGCYVEFAYFGIFDGHGGDEASAFAKERLLDNIVEQEDFWSDDTDCIRRAIRKGFLDTHEAMWEGIENWRRTPSGHTSTAGTTATVCFVRNSTLYIGHVGDSGLVLGYKEKGDDIWKGKPLTKDHKPDDPEERKRIESCGGKVQPKAGIYRVVWNRARINQSGPVMRPEPPIDEIPFLAVARSLGDLWSYNAVSKTYIVSPEPDITIIPLNLDAHYCLIFGTDGVWNVVTPDTAVSVVQTCEVNNGTGMKFQESLGIGLENLMWVNPAKKIIDVALQRWFDEKMRADNISVIVVSLDFPHHNKAMEICQHPDPNGPPSLYMTVVGKTCGQQDIGDIVEQCPDKHCKLLSTTFTDLVKRPNSEGQVKKEPAWDRVNDTGSSSTLSVMRWLNQTGKTETSDAAKFTGILYNDTRNLRIKDNSSPPELKMKRKEQSIDEITNSSSLQQQTSNLTLNEQGSKKSCHGSEKTFTSFLPERKKIKRSQSVDRMTVSPSVTQQNFRRLLDDEQSNIRTPANWKRIISNLNDGNTMRSYAGHQKDLKNQRIDVENNTTGKGTFKRQLDDEQPVAQKRQKRTRRSLSEDRRYVTSPASLHHSIQRQTADDTKDVRVLRQFDNWQSLSADVLITSKSASVGKRSKLSDSLNRNSVHSKSKPVSFLNMNESANISGMSSSYRQCDYPEIPSTNGRTDINRMNRPLVPSTDKLADVSSTEPAIVTRAVELSNVSSNYRSIYLSDNNETAGVSGTRWSTSSLDWREKYEITRRSTPGGSSPTVAHGNGSAVYTHSRSKSVDAHVRKNSELFTHNSPVRAHSRSKSVDVSGRSSPIMTRSRSKSNDVSRQSSPFVPRSRSNSEGISRRRSPVVTRSRSKSVDIRSRSKSGDMHGRSKSYDMYHRRKSCNVHDRSKSYDMHLKSKYRERHHRNSSDSACARGKSGNVHYESKLGNSHCRKEFDKTSDSHWRSKSCDTGYRSKVDDKQARSRLGDGCHRSAHHRSKSQETQHKRKLGDTCHMSKFGDTPTWSKSGDARARSRSRDSHHRSKSREAHHRSKSREAHRRSKSREVHRSSKSREVHRRSKSQEAHRRSKSREVHNRSKSREVHRRSKSQEAHRRSKSREAHNRSKSREAHNRSKSHEAHNRSKSHEAHSRNKSQEAHNRSKSQEAHSRNKSHETHNRSKSQEAHHRHKSGDTHHRSKCSDSHHRSKSGDAHRRSKSGGTYFRSKSCESCFVGNLESHAKFKSIERHAVISTYDTVCPRPLASYQIQEKRLETQSCGRKILSSANNRTCFYHTNEYSAPVACQRIRRSQPSNRRTVIRSAVQQKNCKNHHVPVSYSLAQQKRCGPSSNRQAITMFPAQQPIYKNRSDNSRSFTLCRKTTGKDARSDYNHGKLWSKRKKAHLTHIGHQCPNTEQKSPAENSKPGVSCSNERERALRSVTTAFVADSLPIAKKLRSASSEKQSQSLGVCQVVWKTVHEHKVKKQNKMHPKNISVVLKCHVK